MEYLLVGHENFITRRIFHAKVATEMIVVLFISQHAHFLCGRHDVLMVMPCENLCPLWRLLLFWMNDLPA